MKSETKIYKESFSKKILQYIEETSKDLLDLGIKIILDPRSLDQGIRLYRNTGQGYYMPREISRLKDSSYFKFKEGKFYLTERGRMKIIRNVVKNKINIHEKWDGAWRGIIFDIPEANKKERNFLRRELRHIGCREIQKSVWITFLDIEKELLAILKLWKKDFSGDIRFLKIDKISGEEEIKKYFNI